MEAQNTIVLRDRLTKRLLSLQRTTQARPYSIVHRLNLAEAYKDLGYPDLAAGDAYKALLLIDEVLEQGEYCDEATEAAKIDSLPEGMSGLGIKKHECVDLEPDQLLDALKQADWSRNALDMLIRCLLDCGCLRSAFGYISRARKAYPDDSKFLKYGDALSEKLSSHFDAKGEKWEDQNVDDYPDKGTVRRENYPWNHHEPDRFSDQSLQFLNTEIEKIAPKLEIKAVQLPLLTTGLVEKPLDHTVLLVKQLGVFAKEDLLPGEQILSEKSLLTAVSRLHDTYCNACSAKLPNSRDTEIADNTKSITSCQECDEIYFCSSECHQLAQLYYHPAVCGVSIDLGKTSASEAADSLYTLLLIRALALAETQNLHPLELKEVRYVWADYHGLSLDRAWHVNDKGHILDAFASVPQTLPFSFNNNVLTPLHILEKMGVNIFTQSFRYDTWVFNNLFAKIRGTASAQQGLDARPEIGTVHPLWCVANHSCNPNVSWQWDGSMRFWCRQKLVDWSGSDPNGRAGIKKGEQILSHYCDIRLKVSERREWAIGALGGPCLCERCVQEAAEEQSQDGTAIAN